MTHEASRMRVLVIRGRRVDSLLLAREKNRGLLLCEGFRDRVAATRAKARISHPKMGDTSRLLASQGREFVPVPPAWTFETGLPLKERVLELRDTTVPIISGACTNTVCSSLPHHGQGKTISALGCCISTYCFVDRPHRPGHGSRSRTGLTGRDFRDLGACLRHHTSD